jgi:hypothetical protein
MFSTCKECLEDYDTDDLYYFMVCYVCDHECDKNCDNPCEILEKRKNV